MSFPTAFTTPKRDAFLRYGPGGAQLEKVIHLSTQYAQAVRAAIAIDTHPASSPALAVNHRQWRDEVQHRKAKVLSIDSVQRHLLAPLLEGRAANLSAMLDPWATVLRDIPPELVERHQRGKRADSIECARGSSRGSVLMPTQEENDLTFGGPENDEYNEAQLPDHHALTTESLRPERNYRLPTPREASVPHTPQITPTPRTAVRSTQAQAQAPGVTKSNKAKGKSTGHSHTRLQQLMSEERENGSRPASPAPTVASSTVVGSTSRTSPHTPRLTGLQRPKSRLGISSENRMADTSSTGSPDESDEAGPRAFMNDSAGHRTPSNNSNGGMPDPSPLVDITSSSEDASKDEKRRASQRARCAAWKSRNLQFSNGSTQLAATFSKKRESWEAAGLLPVRRDSVEDEGCEELDERERDMFVWLYETMEEFCKMVDDITSTKKSTRAGDTSRSTSASNRKRSTPSDDDSEDDNDGDDSSTYKQSRVVRQKR